MPMGMWAGIFTEATSFMEIAASMAAVDFMVAVDSTVEVGSTAVDVGNASRLEASRDGRQHQSAGRFLLPHFRLAAVPASSFLLE